MAGDKHELNYHSTLLLKTAIDSGITSPGELANIMGNAHVEGGGFSRMHENFRYRSASAIVSREVDGRRIFLGFNGNETIGHAFGVAEAMSAKRWAWSGPIRPR